MRRFTLAVVLGLVLLSSACGDVLTAPSHKNDPVIVDDGG